MSFVCSLHLHYIRQTVTDLIFVSATVVLHSETMLGEFIFLPYQYGESEFLFQNYTGDLRINKLTRCICEIRANITYSFSYTNYLAATITHI